MMGETPHEPIPLIDSKVVGATVNRVSGGGRLSIYYDRMEFRPGRFVRAGSGIDLIQHTDPSVTIVRSRLLPPWMNRHMILQDGGVRGLINISAGRSRWLEVLTNAGFAIQLDNRWISMGGS